MTALQKVKTGELDSMREKLEADLEDYKKEHSKEIAKQESLHEAEIKRELLKELAAEKLRIRREQSRKEAQMIDKLFEEAGEKLDEFRETPAYKETLKDCILKIVEFAAGDDVDIYLCAGDAQLKDGIEADLKDVFNPGSAAADGTNPGVADADGTNPGVADAEESASGVAEGWTGRSNVRLIVSDSHFNGGVQAAIPSRNIFINDSFSSLMIEKKREYALKV